MKKRCWRGVGPSANIYKGGFVGTRPDVTSYRRVIGVPEFAAKARSWCEI
jgi:hypothetical protein